MIDKELATYLQNNLTADEFNQFQTLLSGLETKEFDLLTPVFFEIDGINTFNAPIFFELKKGLNVIFAPAHNGKTTFVNSLFFTITGKFESNVRKLSYFTSRIKGKYLRFRALLKDSKTSYELIRIIYRQQGNKKATLSDVGKKRQDFEALTKETVRTWNEVQNFLRKVTGVSTDNELADIYSAFFFTEDRNFILAQTFRRKSSRLYRNQLINILSKRPTYNVIIQTLKAKLTETRRELRNITREKMFLEQLATEYNQSRESQRDDEPSYSREELTQRHQELKMQLKKLLKERNEHSLFQQQQFQTLLQERDRLNRMLVERKNELENLEQLEALSKGITEVRCSLCQENIPSAVIKRRLSEGLCPQCGQTIATFGLNYRRELENEVSQITEELNQISKKLEGIVKPGNELLELEDEIRKIQEELRTIEYRLQQYNEIITPKTEPPLNLEEKLAAHQKRIEELEKYIELWNKILKLIEEFVKEKHFDFVRVIETRFRQLQTSIFGSVLIDLNADMSLKCADRNMFEDFSRTERKLLDLIFRLSLVEALLEYGYKDVWLIIETPETDLDVVYQDALAELFASYSTPDARQGKQPRSEEIKMPRIILTIVNQNFYKTLRKKIPLNELLLAKYSTTKTEKQQYSLEAFFEQYF